MEPASEAFNIQNAPYGLFWYEIHNVFKVSWHCGWQIAVD